MSIEKANFDAIAEEDLAELIAAQVPEGLRIEYKSAPYGNAGEEKREFLKDISAFANSQGGHLIIGIEEDAGAAKTFVGLGDLDVDAELLRLQQVANGGLEPRITGLRMRAVALAAGGHVLLCRVPRSWNRPHRVVAQGSNRFYVRHAAGVHQPNVEELRALFTESASTLEKARDFRLERLEAIQGGIGERPLANEGRVILHIVPVASFSGAVAIDIEEVYAQHLVFRPMAAEGMTPRFNFHGFINERGGEVNNGYTQVFRDGRVEATRANIIHERNGERFVPGTALERSFFEAYSSYVSGLRDLDVPPPFIIMVTLEGFRGLNYLIGRNRWENQRPLDGDCLFLPECTLEDYGGEREHHQAVRPAFDALWNAIGYARAQLFDQDGVWVGEPR